MSLENAIAKSISSGSDRRRLARRKRLDALFARTGFLVTLTVLSVLLALIGQLAVEGAGRLSWQFLTSYPSRFAAQAGILSAWIGTILVMLLTALVAVPLGLGAAVYLEEYAPKNKLTTLIDINIANLAGVPSIVYGLMALALFVYEFRLGQSFLTAGLTLALLVLPMTIIAAREAIRAVPPQIREAAYALGATKWQTVRHHVLPCSMGGIMTGLILALSRAVGETAPLITVGALSFIAFLPHPPWQAEAPFISFQWMFDPFTVMPIQMFNWVSRPQEDFHVNAAAAGLVLLLMTLAMNALAIAVRARYRKRIRW
ncbi:MAG TPA: phosphate ABC transporter permease PstA [Nitrospira sp.]|nr:phosphate ABC transporter permease PstA [Nitrospira sp.]